MEPLKYYAEQSSVTNPGAYSQLFSDLPKSINELCRVVQGVCLQYTERHKYPIQNERLLETNLRSVEAIIKQIISLDKSPLSEIRPQDKRFMASSSHFANLLCAMGRHHGISIRKRAGFADYLSSVPGKYTSHDIAEYWNESQNCWVLVDSYLDATAIEDHGIKFDIHDVPRDKFLTAGLAWQSCRNGKIDTALFVGDGEFCGLDIVKSNLILDLASMTKRELLNWDSFAWIDRPIKDFSDKELAVLDHVAELLQSKSDVTAEIQALYEKENGLQVTKIVTCNTPVCPTHKVEITC